MEEKIMIAVSPPVQVGGSLFTAEQLLEISKLIGPDQKIEMTPFKQLYVEIPAPIQAEVTERLKLVGLEVNPSGFATKSLIACNFCRGPEEAGLDFAQRLNQAISGILTPTPLKIGYAGCALGTSEPLIKDIAVVKMKNRFDIYVGGDSKGIKATFAQLLLSGLSEEEVIPLVLKLIDYYKAEAKGKEKFGKFVKRITIEQLKLRVS
ncbi:MULTISPECIES: nitrite reductase [Paenibacillus]|uniref:nitrite reductase n=1 Tax=Paenibacillus TaxID=44249 RepID=UPI00119DD079|nr:MULTISPECIES: nitrite reductase [Paenibacillus]MBJ9993532.1 nitrite reductase [Paenibacillus sp. S28]